MSNGFFSLLARLKFLTFCFVAGIGIKGTAQTFHLSSRAGIQVVFVNGKPYNIDSVGLKIETKFPGFDSFVFKSEGSASGRRIICNFKQDSSYSIVNACCGSLDIIPSSKLKALHLDSLDAENNFEKFREHFSDKPFISIRTTRLPKDSVYAWHADASCATEHRLISSTLWKMGVPPKCFYWSNITAIVFFKTDSRSSEPQNKDIAELLDKKNVIELATVYLRLFDNQRFIVEFNESKRSVKLRYE